MAYKAVHVRISGRVQGVFFRLWTREQAQRLGVRGWVRNRTGGGVEAHFEGAEEAVEALVEACRSGPSSAVVTELEAAPVEPTGAAGFEVRPTA